MTRDDLLKRGWEFRANYYDRVGGGFHVGIYFRGQRFCDGEGLEPTLALAEKAALEAFAALTS